MTQFNIYIVEDDPWYGELLKYHLSLNPDFKVTLFDTGKKCLDSLDQAPDVVCIDFKLPDISGDQLLEQIKSFDKNIPVIVISSQEAISVAVNLLKAGATDYIIKDEASKDLLWNAILKIRENSSLRQEVKRLRQQLEQKYSFEKTIIGQSPAIRSIFSLIEKAIKTNINVSISGETGTGKEVVAQAIHYNSSRKNAPFVAINMTAIPDLLIESELFGHEKGAFTGAVTRKLGKFEEAQGGTIFLDEIAEMDLSMQGKILRVLQEREVVRIGGSEKIKLDVRLITATHKKLSEEVKKGNFRQDLYYRIIGLPIEMPALRERGNDILILSKHFVERFVKSNPIEALHLSSDAQEKLIKYHYPGNIRELKAIIELACVMCEDREIRAEDIRFPALTEDATFTAIEKTMREYNCDIIKHFLKKYNNNVVLVANKLEIGKSTIYKMIKQKEIIL